jgi:hypothetical protein
LIVTVRRHSPLNEGRKKSSILSTFEMSPATAAKAASTPVTYLMGFARDGFSEGCVESLMYVRSLFSSKCDAARIDSPTAKNYTGFMMAERIYW